MTAPDGPDRYAASARRTFSVLGWVQAHPVPVDIVIAALCAVVLVPMAISIIGDSTRGHAAQVFLYVAVGVLHACVAARRARPAAAYLVGAIAMLALAWGPTISSGGVEVPAVFLPDSVVFFILLYSIAAASERRTATAGLLVALVGAVMVTVQLIVASRSTALSGSAGLLLIIALLFIAALGTWGLGRLRRTRAAYVAELESKARRAEQDRQREAAEVIAAERARIARELHDVVSHSLAVMIAQAEGGRMVAKSRDPKSSEVFDIISATGRTALSDMRSMVGLLRAPDAELEQLRPEPGVDEITSLIERTRAAGLPVTMHTEGRPRALPAAAGLAAYRAVQEAITNVVKHAGPGARADVRLDWGPDRLRVWVIDDGVGARPGRPGVGLLGLRERLAAIGGSVAAGDRGGGFELTATIPYPATDEEPS